MQKSNESTKILPAKPRRELTAVYEKNNIIDLEIEADKSTKNTEKPSVDQNDAEITTNIKAEIMNDPLLKNFHTNVFTQNEKVELSGAVDHQNCIGRSKEISNGVKGVRSVDSEIIAKKNVKKAHSVKDPLKESEVEMEVKQRLDTGDSSFFTSKIKAEVKTEPLLKEFQIKISTRYGIVKISGEVDSLKSIERIKKIVSNVEGVKTFESNLFARKVEQ